MKKTRLTIPKKSQQTRLSIRGSEQSNEDSQGIPHTLQIGCINTLSDTMYCNSMHSPISIHSPIKYPHYSGPISGRAHCSCAPTRSAHNCALKCSVAARPGPVVRPLWRAAAPVLKPLHLPRAQLQVSFRKRATHFRALFLENDL